MTVARSRMTPATRRPSRPTWSCMPEYGKAGWSGSASARRGGCGSTGKCGTSASGPSWCATPAPAAWASTHAPHRPVGGHALCGGEQDQGSRPSSSARTSSRCRPTRQAQAEGHGAAAGRRDRSGARVPDEAGRCCARQRPPAAASDKNGSGRYYAEFQADTPGKYSVDILLDRRADRSSTSSTLSESDAETKDTVPTGRRPTRWPATPTTCWPASRTRPRRRNWRTSSATLCRGQGGADQEPADKGDKDKKKEEKLRLVFT